MYDNSFEKDPGDIETKGERAVPEGQDFEKSFEEGVPPFAGEQFGTAHRGNEFYGEATADDAESTDETELDAYNEGLANAAAIFNYGIDPVAREKGIAGTIRSIKEFDPSNSDNPLRDFYIHAGIETFGDLKDVRDEALASRAIRNRFREEYEMPKSQKRTREGFIKAIQDMKELIAEVEGADPRYQELRDAAKAYGKDYFEYAVKDYGVRGLTDLFGVLAKQKEQKEQKEQQEQEQQEQPEVKPEEFMKNDPSELSGQ